MILAINAFATHKEKAIQIAKIMIKLCEQLDVTHFIEFNGVKIELIRNGSLYFYHESHLLV